METNDKNFKIKENKNNGCLIIGVLFSICTVAFFCLIISVITFNKRHDDEEISTDSIISVKNDSIVSTPNRWQYEKFIEEMDDSETRTATITSDNSMNFDSPYQGGSYMTIVVRKTKKWGTDVFIRISDGQFVCSNYNGTNYVRVRFDEKAPIKFTTNEASDGSTDMLFLDNPHKFITFAKKAKRILIEAPFYEEGFCVFTFTTDKKLEWQK